MPSPIEVILIPTVMILLGYLLKTWNILSHDNRETLSDIVIYVCLPSLIFTNMYKANISQDMLILPIAGLLLSFILVMIALAYCRMRGYSRKTTWTIILAVSMMNTGFIGFPVTMGLFGEIGFLNAIFFDLSTTILFIIYGILLAREYGKNRRDVIINTLKFIPLWAVIIALIFNHFNIGLFYVAENVLKYFGEATIPLIMLAVGLNLDFRSIGENLSDSLVVSVIKLVISPIVVCVILSLLNIGGMAFNVGIIEAGMCTAMNALVLSIMYDLDSDLMASLLFTNTILCLFSLSIIISLLI